MLFLSSDKSNKDSFYLNLLSKNLRLEQFKSLQIVSVSSASTKTLNLDSVPTFLDCKGTPLISLQKISTALTNEVKLTPLLVGRNQNESSSVFKWFELDYKMRYQFYFFFAEFK